MIRFLLVSVLWIPLQLCILSIRLVLSWFSRPVPISSVSANVSGVSVMILNWNGLELMKKNVPEALRLMKIHCKVPWELLVVDNGSEDGSVKYLRSIQDKNLSVLELDQNYFFSGGNNRGLKECKYSHVLVMNNDIFPTGDFINPLIKAFKKDKKTFAVSGQMFFSKDKRREESGYTQIFFEKKFRLQHEVDSPDYFATTAWPGGGFTLFDKKKLSFLGGFNELYQPFYYEDTDLGMRAWRLGWPSFYEPSSQVIHLHKKSVSKLDPKYVETVIEMNRYKYFLTCFTSAQALRAIFASVVFNSGSLTSSVIVKTYLQIPKIIVNLVRNNYRSVYSDRDVERFSRHFSYYKYAKKSSWIIKKNPGRKNVLFLSVFPPIPVHGGGVRIFNKLRVISKKANIYMLTYVSEPPTHEQLEFISESTKQFEFLKLSKRRSKFGLPYFFSEFWSNNAKKKVLNYLDQNDIDVIDFDFTQSAYLLPDGMDRVKKIITEHDVSFISFLRRYRADGLVFLLFGLKEIVRIFKYEQKYLKKFDVIVSVSDNDKLLLSKLVKNKKMVVISNGVDLGYFRRKKPYSTRLTKSTMFIGSFMHTPNKQAVEFFAKYVLPNIKNPEARLLNVVGEVDKRAKLVITQDINYLGFVDDTRSVYESSRLFIAPVVSGSGTRIKILEAMAMGVPVISTRIGAEGLNLSKDSEVIICSNAKDMGNKISEIYSDEKKLKKMSLSSRKLVEQQYSWEKILSKYLEIYA